MSSTVEGTASGSLVAYGWSDRVLGLFNDLAGPGDEPARVVRVERVRSVVVGADGLDHVVSAKSPPAVGDWVAVQDGMISAVLPRWSALTRKDPDGSSDQVLAANVDLVIITAPADRLSAARVDRELAIAWDSGGRPLVALTKADLGPAGLRADLAARLVGVDVVATSVIDRAGIDAIAAEIRPHRTAVLLGPSGAGKSTLANALLGSDVLATGEVRVADQRGRHTTTTRRLLPVPGGGVLIDTPGLRSLGLSGDGGLEEVFRDIETLGAGCRFGDCRHQVEPGCAVVAAVSAGTLDDSRLASYLKLQREGDAAEQRVDPSLRKAKLSEVKAQVRSARARRRTEGK